MYSVFSNIFEATTAEKIYFLTKCKITIAAFRYKFAITSTYSLQLITRRSLSSSFVVGQHPKPITINIAVIVCCPVKMKHGYASKLLLLHSVSVVWLPGYRKTFQTSIKRN